MSRDFFYHELATNSRRAILRTKKQWGKPYQYRPKIPLVKRLAKKYGMTHGEVIDQLKAERKQLLATL